MARRLAVNVALRHPDTRRVQVFEAGTTPPAWAADAMHDHVWEGSPEHSGEPPRAGRGSGRDTWAEFAQEHNIAVPDDAGRDDIVALLAERGIVEE